MRISTLALLSLGVLAGLSVFGCWVSAAEVVKVRAVETVPLFDPNSLAGQIGDAPHQVGELAVGQELSVVSCTDRKSDFNILAAYQDKVVAVGEWKAEVQLLRRPALPWEQGAITSCQGFYKSVSVHAQPVAQADWPSASRLPCPLCLMRWPQ
jgi:hypothetical protein